jgi:hypothetical protein
MGGWDPNGSWGDWLRREWSGFSLLGIGTSGKGTVFICLLFSFI